MFNYTFTILASKLDESPTYYREQCDLIGITCTNSVTIKKKRVSYIFKFLREEDMILAKMIVFKEK